jgi:hypothetical protein
MARPLRPAPASVSLIHQVDCRSRAAVPADVCPFRLRSRLRPCAAPRIGSRPVLCRRAVPDTDPTRRSTRTSTDTAIAWRCASRDDPHPRTAAGGDPDRRGDLARPDRLTVVFVRRGAEVGTLSAGPGALRRAPSPTHRNPT